MNAQRLLTAFAKIGDHPDRIDQLRKIAVALAISGKLDNGAASMTPSQILDAVNRVKAGLEKRGAIPKPKRMEEVTADQLPADFSDAARFAPLGELARIEKGLTGIQQAQPGEYPLVVTSAERSTCDHFDFDGAAAIIPLVSSTGHGNASINRLHYQERKFALGTILVAAFPYDPALISARFLFEYMSAFKEELLVSRMTGTANVTLSVGRVAEVPVPLICPEVQRNVDDLLALCDQLEQARAGREALRDRLTAATWARLTAPETDAETFPTYARAALQTLPVLTTRPDQIKTLRQTILNLAVRGKLVEQDAGDQPAVTLLRKIAAETLRRAQVGEFRLPKDAAALTDMDLPFTLPENWQWTQIAKLGALNPRNTAEDGKLASFVPMPMIAAEFGVANGHKPRKWNEIKQGYTHFAEGDVGLAKITPCFENGKSTIFKGLTGGIGAGTTELHILRPVLVSPEYVLLVLKSPYFIETGIPKMTGTAGQKRVSSDYFAYSPFPLPPLAEQHRIVAKVEELMSLCDRLERALQDATTTRARLLDAILRDALADAQEAA